MKMNKKSYNYLLLLIIILLKYQVGLNTCMLQCCSCRVISLDYLKLSGGCRCWLWLPREMRKIYYYLSHYEAYREACNLIGYLLEKIN